MAGQGTRAGRAFLEMFLDSRAAIRSLNTFQRRFQQMATRLRSLGTNLLAAGAGGSVGGALLFRAAIKDAASFEQKLGKLEAVFKGLSADAQKFASDLGNSLGGRSSAEIGAVLTDFQAQLQAVGIDAAKAFDLSKNLTKAAFDLQAFEDGLSIQEAARAFRIALSGEVSDVITRAAGRITDFAVKQELLRRGIDASTQVVSEAEKALIRYDLVMRGLGAGGVIGQAAREVDTLSALMNQMGDQIKDFRGLIGSALAPAFRLLSGHFRRFLDIGKEFVKQNPQLVSTLGFSLVALTGVGAALITASAAFAAASFVTGQLATAIGLLLSPIGLVTVGIGAAAAAFLLFTKKGEDATEFLRGEFSGLEDHFRGVIKGIGDALSTGDINLAADVLWAALDVTFQEGIAKLNQHWIGWKTFFLRVQNEATHSLAKGFVEAFTQIEIAWTKSQSDILTSSLAIGRSATSLHAETTKSVAKGILDVEGLLGSAADKTKILEGQIRDLTAKENIFRGPKTRTTTNEDKARAEVEQRKQQRLDAFAALEDDLNRKRLTREREFASSIAKARQEREDKLDEIDEAAKNKDKSLEDQKAAAERQIAAEEEAAQQASRERLDKARTAWEEASQRAADAAKAAAEEREKRKGGGGAGAGDFNLDELVGGMEVLTRNQGVAFAGLASQVFSGNLQDVQKQQLDVQKKIADAAKQIAKNTKDKDPALKAR